MAEEYFSVEIESLDQEGRGIAHREGKVAFVEGALPGERVRYERRRNKASYESGRVVAVERESSLRTTPRCPYFGIGPGTCGGCSMQHLDPRAQVAIKQRVLEDALWHIGRLRPAQILRPIAGSPWRYRHRARLAVRYVPKKGGVLVGFHERASSYVADMRSCEVLPAHVSALIGPLRDLVGALSIRDRLPQIELAIADSSDGPHTVLVFRILRALDDADRARLAEFGRVYGVDIWLQPAGPETAAPLSRDDPAELALALPEFGLTLPFGPTDFTQVNHGVNEVLIRRALQLLAPRSDEIFVDFFCGLGNFTLPLASRSKRVFGIEGSRSLVRRAAEAAQANRLGDRTEFGARDLFEWTDQDWRELVEHAGSIDGALVDPPREGALAVARSLAATDRRPERVVYVSCNPATLARDCAVLVHEGGWQLAAAGVVNMFPQTSHVESIALLRPGNRPDHGPEGASAASSHAKISG